MNDEIQTNQLTFMEKLNKRVEILIEFANKSSILHDKIRNIRDVELANDGNLEVQLDCHFRKSFFAGQLDRLCTETEGKLQELRKPKIY